MIKLLKKQKRIFSVIMAIGLIAAALSFGFIMKSNPVYAADLSESESDAVFYETISQLMQNNTQYDQKLVADKTILHDIDLKPLGYLYDFTLADYDGYAIIINSTGHSIPTEFFEEAPSPYNHSAEISVYVSEFVYAEYNSAENVFQMNNGVKLNRQEIEKQYENYYCGFDYNLVETNTQIAYSLKSNQEYMMGSAVPTYDEAGLEQTKCSPIAGTNIIAYFDRTKTGLIPNYTPVIGLGSVYRFKAINDTINGLILNLYNRMGTDQTQVGTTIAGFQNGMRDYCTSTNYQINFSSCINKYGFDYALAKNKIDEGQPIAMFFSLVSISTIQEGNNLDSYLTISGQANHVMVGFGYREITYTYANGTSQNFRFIKTSTGMLNKNIGYLNLDDSRIDDAYAVNIW